MSRTQPQQVARAKAFKRILLDKEIPHGAFRLYHLLLDHDGGRGCFPSIRTLCRELGSNTHAVSRWRDQLAAAGYMSFEVGGRYNRTFYHLLLPKAVTLESESVAGTGNASVAESGKDSVTGTGKLTNPHKLNPETKGESRPPVSASQGKKPLYPKEYDNLISDAQKQIEKIRVNFRLGEIPKEEASRAINALKEKISQWKSEKLGVPLPKPTPPIKPQPQPEQSAPQNFCGVTDDEWKNWCNGMRAAVNSFDEDEWLKTHPKSF